MEYKVFLKNNLIGEFDKFDEVSSFILKIMEDDNSISIFDFEVYSRID